MSLRELWISPTTTNPNPGSTNAIVGFQPYGSTMAPRHATTTTIGHYVTLGYTQSSPMHRLVNNLLSTVSNEKASGIVTAYPNPFQDVFKFNMTTTSSEIVQVKVYDMLGKLMEDFNVAANEMNNLQIGQNYQSGLYNIKVSQGDKAQSIRMIKQ